MKLCSVCKTSKEETEFHKQPLSKDGLHASCKACRSEYTKRYRSQNKEKLSIARKLNYARHKEQEKAAMKRYQQTHKLGDKGQRAFNLKSKYNLTVSQYDNILFSQDSVCAICKQSSSNGFRLAVDHNHTTNENRGLLCHRCNTSLGLLNENIDTLINMIEYLKKYS